MYVYLDTGISLNISANTSELEQRKGAHKVEVKNGVVYICTHCAWYRIRSIVFRHLLRTEDPAWEGLNIIVMVSGEETTVAVDRDMYH